MSKQINFTYDSLSSIDAAIKEMQAYQEQLTHKCRILAQRVAEIGVEIARVNIADFDAIYSGELLSSIRAEYSGSVPDCPWAAYVEFGTGVVGQESPHPDISIVGWKYDVNQHGDMGWYYFKDGEWHWTKGMPSRPFLYQTGMDLRERIEEIAREVFAGA